MKSLRLLVLVCTALLCFQRAYAISTGGHRVTVLTEHFEISVDRGKSDVLPQAAAWLENAYAIESPFFDFQTTERTEVVLLDEEDISNGFAFAQNQWIVIYMDPNRFQLRGTATWFSNVSAHELTHILTLRKMGLTSKFSGLDIFGSWSKSHWTAQGDAAWIPQSVPSWLAEGLAQYGSMHCGFDTLDSHREMLLREAWRSGNLIPLKSMETYADDARSSEMIYNQGFHLVDFLYRTYGRDAMNTMMASWQSEGYTGSFRKAFGTTPDEIFALWKKELATHFLATGAVPVTLSPFGPPYVVRDAPLYDPASRTLYYLSSWANDFGATGLFSKRGNSLPHLIQRDVNAPVHMAPDGSLLYTALRYDPGTGAQLTDLYRYRPNTGSVWRLTHDLRVASAVETDQNQVYAILRESGRTSLALLQYGRVVKQLTAPPGTEFMDLAASGDTLLYIGAVRGNNSDILGFDTRSGKLYPVLASHHNERDPFVKSGRLYFSSDADGSYSIYSLQGNSIYRHTPPFSEAFAPFVDGNSLWYSGYTPEGFLLHSQPLDSGELLAELGSPTNVPVPSPPLPPAQSGYERDRTTLELTDYSVFAGYAQTLYQTYVDPNSGTTFHYNPCGPQAFAGATMGFGDPGQRNFVNAVASVGQCLDIPSAPYVPLAYVGYTNRDFTPDILLQAEYQSLPFNRPFEQPRPYGLINNFQLNSEFYFHLGNYFYDAPQFGFQGNIISQPDDVYGTQTSSTFGLLASNTLGFQFVDEGMDFINQGLLGNATVLLGSGGFATPGSLEAHTNLDHLLFLGAEGSGEWLANDIGSGVFGSASVAADLRLPVSLTLGSVGYRGLFLEAAFFHASFSVQNHYQSESFFSYPDENALSGNSALWQRNLLANQPRGDSPVPIFIPEAPISRLVDLGVHLKIISPSSRLVMWNLDWQASPTNLNNPYFSTSISL